VISRFLVILLIATIVVCPLCCSFGMCHAADCEGQACHQESSVSEPMEAPCCSDRCCASPLAQQPADCPPDSQDDQPSQQPPCQDSCQGICGGALSSRDNDVENQALISTSFELAPLPMLQTMVLAASTPCYQPQMPGQLVCFGLSPGRRMRMLHMSWLC
jgi:hypothetical protein